MSPEEMRIVIAETCGWRGIEGNASWPNKYWKRPGDAVLCAECELPEYLESRDAAISAVVELYDTFEKKDRFRCCLFGEVAPLEGSSAAEHEFTALTATAEQICKALCAALKLGDGK